MKRYFDDHVLRAIARITQEVREVEGVQELTTAFVQEVQEVGDMLLDIFLATDPDEAQGAQLDRLGRLLFTPRLGLVDDEYRRFIKAAQILRGSSGEVDTILTLALLLLNVDYVQFIPGYPHGFTLGYASLNTLSDSYKKRLKDVIIKAAIAEVDVAIVEFEGEELSDGLRFGEGTFDGAGMYRTI